jgi:phosphotransferase system enzyme I (PtsP)
MPSLAASRIQSPLEILVHKLGDILSTQQTLQVRFTIAMKVLAQEMGADTAILYLLTPDHFLEVYAAYDALTPDHKKVRFRVGEGIVGLIASSGKSLICDNISRHPNFLHRPGIADHINLALLGIPLITSRGIVGVLTLQNPPSKPFEEWREKGLLEVGNYIANLPELERFAVLNLKEGKVEGKQELDGISFNPGVAIGTAVIHQPYSWKENAFCSDTKIESERLKEAIRTMIESIDRLKDANPNLDQNTHDVLSSYRLIASDRGWVRKIQEYIHKGFTAEASVQKVRRHTRERYAQIGDTILKARLSDLEDLASRLLKHLSGKEGPTEDLPESSILVAQNLGPAELLDYDRRFIKGLILEEGVHTAHVAIIARALDIPVVGRVPLLLSQITAGDKLIVDGSKGKVIVAPQPEDYQEAREKIAQIKSAQIIKNELKDLPCKTKDGISVSLTLNAGLPIDLHHLDEITFDAVGLYRTEIPFMMRSTFPDVKTQTEIYRDVLEQAKSLPITFRTLDIGGDKVVPYMWRVHDENPVLGWRAMRVALDKPAILRQQVRALIKASEGRDLRILFPLVTDIMEYRAAKEFVRIEWERAKDHQAELPKSISYGVMLEVPSIVDQLDTLLKEVDFISIGTNDLFQFYFACDRTNPTVSNRYDTLSTTFLNYLRNIRVACTKAKVPVSVCGEMAGKPLDALALLAIGYKTLSASGPLAIALKKMILSLSLKEAEIFMEDALKDYSPSLRPTLMEFAKTNKVFI